MTIGGLNDRLSADESAAFQKLGKFHSNLELRHGEHVPVTHKVHRPRHTRRGKKRVNHITLYGYPCHGRSAGGLSIPRHLVAG